MGEAESEERGAGTDALRDPSPFADDGAFDLHGIVTSPDLSAYVQDVVQYVLEGGRVDLLGDGGDVGTEVAASLEATVGMNPLRFSMPSEGGAASLSDDDGGDDFSPMPMAAFPGGGGSSPVLEINDSFDVKAGESLLDPGKLITIDQTEFAQNVHDEVEFEIKISEEDGEKAFLPKYFTDSLPDSVYAVSGDYQGLAIDPSGSDMKYYYYHGDGSRTQVAEYNRQTGTLSFQLHNVGGTPSLDSGSVIGLNVLAEAFRAGESFTAKGSLSLSTSVSVSYDGSSETYSPSVSTNGGSESGAGDGSGDGSESGSGNGSESGSGNGSESGAGDGSDDGSGSGTESGSGSGSESGSGEETDPGGGKDPGPGDDSGDVTEPSEPDFDHVHAGGDGKQDGDMGLADPGVDFETGGGDNRGDLSVYPGGIGGENAGDGTAENHRTGETVRQDAGASSPAGVDELDNPYAAHSALALWDARADGISETLLNRAVFLAIEAIDALGAIESVASSRMTALGKAASTAGAAVQALNRQVAAMLSSYGAMENASEPSPLRDWVLSRANAGVELSIEVYKAMLSLAEAVGNLRHGAPDGVAESMLSDTQAHLDSINISLLANAKSIGHFITLSREGGAVAGESDADAIISALRTRDAETQKLLTRLAETRDGVYAELMQSQVLSDVAVK